MSSSCWHCSWPFYGESAGILAARSCGAQLLSPRFTDEYASESCSILFTIGKTLIGLYLGQSNVASSYGAAGSLIIVLLWVYYSAQILFFGAELTQVYANEFGSRIVPDTNAISTRGEPVTAAKRSPAAPARAPMQSAVPVTGSPMAMEHENRQTVRALVGMVAASFVAGIVSTLSMLRSNRKKR